jgi:hypothetical protein
MDFFLCYNGLKISSFQFNHSTKKAIITTYLTYQAPPSPSIHMLFQRPSSIINAQKSIIHLPSHESLKRNSQRFLPTQYKQELLHLIEFASKK